MASDGVLVEKVALPILVKPGCIKFTNVTRNDLSTTEVVLEIHPESCPFTELTPASIPSIPPSLALLYSAFYQSFPPLLKESSVKEDVYGGGKKTRQRWIIKSRHLSFFHISYLVT